MTIEAVIAARDGQFYIKKETLPEEQLKKYRSELSYILPKTESKYQQAAVSVWSEIKGYVRLPRMLGMRDFPGQFKNKLPELPVLKSWVSAQNHYETVLSQSLFEYQTEAITVFHEQYFSDMIKTSILDSVKDSSLNLGGIIKFGCGRGKTRTALCCAAVLGKKTLIICNGDTPCNSFVQEIMKSFGSTAPKYVLLSSIKNSERKKVLSDPEIPIVISCYKTIIYPGNFEPEDFKSVDLTIMDEVHEYLTPKSLEIFNFVSRRFIIGLSATPTKPNGLHFLLDYFVGPIMIECQNLYDGALPEVHKLYFDTANLEFEKGEPYQKIQEKIQSAPARQDLIVTQVLKYYAESTANRILVIGIMRSLLEKYRDAIESTLGSDTCALYYAVNTKSEKELRDKHIQERRIVLAIRQMGGQSLNIPDLNVMILASKYIPKNEGENTEKIEQLMGRVMRKRHSKSPVIVDIIDRHFYFLKHDKLCTAYYLQCGFKVYDSRKNTTSIEEDEFEEKSSFEDEFS